MGENSFYYGPQPGRESGAGQADFDQLEASELYCSECRCAMPVRKHLLLVLPDGDRYEYRCQGCGAKVGDKIDRSGQFFGVLKEC